MGVRLADWAIACSLVLGMVACSGSGESPTTAVTGTSGNPAPSHHARRDAVAASRAAFLALAGAGEAGSFEWRCTDRGQAVIKLVLSPSSATDYVRVYAGRHRTVNRLLQPGQHVTVRLPNNSYERWRIRQATEPRTLSVRARIYPNPASGCLGYLAPTVYLKSVSHSH